MFAAAMLFAAPNTEISIYSTCKRISQKLLRNVIKFLELIYVGMGVPKFRVLRENMEELVIRGPESIQDIRIVNSYPSKVRRMGERRRGFGAGRLGGAREERAERVRRARCRTRRNRAVRRSDGACIR